MFPFPTTGISRTQKTIDPIQVATMVDYVNNFLVPYVVETRKKLGFSQDHPALVMFDVFKGQLNTDIFDLLDANNIMHVIVPANTTDKLQPLDLSVCQRFFENQISGVVLGGYS